MKRGLYRREWKTVKNCRKDGVVGEEIGIYN